MARVSELDFGSFVAKKNAAFFEGGDYAYVSDRQTRATFEKMSPVVLAVAACVRAWKEWGRSSLLGHAVRVTDKQFPRIAALNERAARTLGIATPALFIGQNPNLNAGTYGTNDDSFILVNSSVIDHFTDFEILDILGHEAGHIQNNHVVYLTTLHFLTNMVGAFVGWFTAPARVALMAWSRRAEVTCDRAGLLVVKDLDVCTRGLMKLALGSRKLYDELNADEYLKQYDEGRAAGGRWGEIFQTHPYLPKRIHALKIFSQSALYRKAAGIGDGGISIHECDEKTHAIIKILG